MGNQVVYVVSNEFGNSASRRKDIIGVYSNGIKAKEAMNKWFELFNRGLKFDNVVRTPNRVCGFGKEDMYCEVSVSTPYAVQ